MTERRYSEAEVATIFEQATEVQQHARRQLPPGEGMTLADLQEIGREVGIPAELVSQAARSLDLGAPATARMVLGLPYAVQRTVDLDRRMSEAEWERLVVDLRQTFDAKGVVRADGSLRQWTNGNLQVLLEPTDTGHRVRLRTVHGGAQRGFTAGIAAMVSVAAVVISRLVSGGLGDPKTLTGVVFLALLGVGMLAVGALRLPVWARARKRQMDGIAARLALPPASSGVLIP